MTLLYLQGNIAQHARLIRKNISNFRTVSILFLKCFYLQHHTVVLTKECFFEGSTVEELSAPPVALRKFHFLKTSICFKS